MAGVIADTFLLLELRWRLTWNAFAGRKLWQMVLLGLGAIWVGLFVAGGAGFLGFVVGRLIRRTGDPDLAALPIAGVLAAATALLLFSSFGLALGSLYLATDLDRLMTAPIDRRAVFLAKIFDGFGVEYAIVGVTATPFLTTYGVALGYGPVSLLLAAIALAATPLLPAGFGALLVLIVVRFAPVRRIREVVGLAGALLSLAAVILGQTARFWIDRFAPARGDDAAATLAPLQELLAIPFPPFLAARGLAAAGAGDPAGAIGGLGAALGLEIGLFAVCLAIADRLYATGWTRLQSAGAARRRPTPAHARAGFGWTDRAPAALAIALKDWTAIPRDLRYLIQILAPLIFLPIVFFNTVTSAGGRRSGAFGSAADVWLAAGIDPAGIFVAIGILISVGLLFSQLAATGISREGRAWWLIKAAPIRPVEILLGKLLVVLIPYTILSTLLLAIAALWRGFSPLGFLHGWIGVEAIGAGMLALSVGLAVPWARLDWTDPRQMASTWASGLALVGTLIVGLIAGGLIGLPVVARVLAPEWTGPAYLIGLPGGVLAAAAIGGAAFWIGLRRIGAIGGE